MFKKKTKYVIPFPSMQNNTWVYKKNSLSMMKIRLSVNCQLNPRVTKKCVFIKNTLGSISLEHKYHLFRDAFRIHSADKLFMLFFNNVWINLISALMPTQKQISMKSKLSLHFWLLISSLNPPPHLPPPNPFTNVAIFTLINLKHRAVH